MVHRGLRSLAPISRGIWLHQGRTGSRERYRNRRPPGVASRSVPCCCAQREAVSKKSNKQSSLLHGIEYSAPPSPLRLAEIMTTLAVPAQAPSPQGPVAADTSIHCHSPTAAGQFLLRPQSRLRSRLTHYQALDVTPRKRSARKKKQKLFPTPRQGISHIALESEANIVTFFVGIRQKNNYINSNRRK